MGRLAIVAVLAACGRLGFDLPRSTPDGGALDDGGDGGGTSDAGARPNRAFVTSGTFTGAVGGLAGADASCNAAATAAGLPGTFVAFLSTSTVNAKDRLAGSSGWVRVDGEPLFDSATSWLARKLLNPIDVDENGMTITTVTDAWTGNSTYPGAWGNCSDFTSASAGATGSVGAMRMGATNDIEDHSVNCANSVRLYCFEVGQSAPISPVVTPGRIAFLSKPVAGPLSAMDAQCASDAGANALGGTYLAAVATTSTSIASRFTLDSRTWRRVDGTYIAAASEIFTNVVSFVDQHADGSRLVVTYWTGTADPTSVGTMATTCNNWSTTSNTVIGTAGNSESLGSSFWGAGGASCNQPLGVMCLEQ